MKALSSSRRNPHRRSRFQPVDERLISDDSTFAIKRTGFQFTQHEALTVVDGPRNRNAPFQDDKKTAPVLALVRQFLTDPVADFFEMRRQEFEDRPV